MYFKILVFSTVLLISINVCEPFGMIAGNTNKNKLYSSNVYYLAAIPKVYRSEIVEIAPKSKIKGIKAEDLNNSRFYPNISAGGVGFNYASLKLKSDLGKSLNYRVEVYV